MKNYFILWPSVVDHYSIHLEENSQVTEDWTDTAWEADHPDGKTVRVTIADMMKLALDETEIPAQDLESVKIDPESQERMMRADTQYPLLVLQYPDGEYRVLDGNHRLGKALHTKQPSVQARVIKHQSLPKEWQWLFRQN